MFQLQDSGSSRTGFWLKTLFLLNILNILLLIYPLLFMGLLQVPSVAQNFSNETALDLNRLSHLSFRQLALGMKGSLALFVLSAAFYRRGAPLGFAFALVVMNTLVWTGLQALVHADRYSGILFQDIIYENYAPFPEPNYLQPEILKPASVQDFEEYAQYMHRKYLSVHEELRKAWHLQDEDQLKAFFYANAVAHLWAYGNKIEPKRAGCVGQNEVTGWDRLNAPLTIKDYLTAEIGCCADYSLMLGKLLAAEGVKVRQVAIPEQHEFNEVWFGGRWNVVDANTGLIFYSPWEGIIRRPLGEKLRVTEFDHPGFNVSSTYYRGEQIKDLRLLMLKWATNREHGEAQISEVARIL